ncbi:MAG: hypothetical protein LBR44_09035 [Clostridiales Family XIII bacterium]|jgi:hypothetical protein|nr:hypothetical protein [Clostridiales Family XIII bacterium]
MQSYTLTYLDLAKEEYFDALMYYKEKRVSDHDLEIVALCLFNTYRDPERLKALLEARL